MKAPSVFTLDEPPPRLYAFLIARSDFAGFHAASKEGFHASNAEDSLQGLDPKRLKIIKRAISDYPKVYMRN